MEDKNYGNEEEIFRFSFSYNGSYASNKCNAFNANGETLTGNDTETMTQNVTVTGEVKSNQGTVAQGRLEVVLPTSMAFSVDQNSNFTNVDLV